MTEKLTYQDHSRYFNDCRYVYPVVSRRSQGLSLGINLNVNNACNWRCVYCQVDGLIRGKPDDIDLVVLEHELRMMLDWIVNGDFIEQFAPEGLRRFNDICLAGNGEPTLSPQFLQVCNLITQLYQEYNLTDVKNLVITNGSQLHIKMVQDGISLLSKFNGEIWFKVDRVTTEGLNQVNQINLSAQSMSERLQLCGSLCSTWIQSCWFNESGKSPALEEITQFVEFVYQHKSSIAGVLLYSVARFPALKEGANITQINIEFLERIAELLAQKSIICRCYQ